MQGRTNNYYSRYRKKRVYNYNAGLYNDGFIPYGNYRGRNGFTSISRKNSVKAAQRQYPRSLVPAASRGYKLNDVELKVFDTAFANTAVNTTGIVTPICLPQLGSDFTNRIGRKITLRSVQVKGQIALDLAIAPGVGNSPAQLVRFMIINDMQPNGTLATIADILLAANPAAPLNLNFRDRFRIITDRIFNLGPLLLDDTATQSYAAVANPSATINVYRRLNDNVVFNTSTGAIADITTGALLLVMIGNVASGAGESLAQLIARVRFADC